MIFYYLILLFSTVPNHPWFGSDVGGLTVFKITGAATMLYTVFYATIRKSSPQYFQSWPIRLFLLLALTASTSYAFTHQSYYVFMESACMVYISHVILSILTLWIVDTESRVRYAVLSLIGAVGIGSLYTLREWQGSGFSGSSGNRPGWVTGDANFFAAALVLVIPIAYYLILPQAKRPRWERLFCLGCLTLGLLAFVAGASRGGLVGFGVAFPLIFARSKHKAQAAGFAAALVLLMLVLPSSPLRRIMEPDYGDDAAVNSRKALWSAGLEMFQDHPLIGVGLGNFKITVRTMPGFDDETAKMAHNTYVEYAAELGIVGVLLFVSILIATFFHLERVRKRAIVLENILVQSVASGMQAGLLACAVALVFISGFYSKPFWIVVFLSACLPTVLSSAAQQTAVGPSGSVRGSAPMQLPRGKHVFPLTVNSARAVKRNTRRVPALNIDE